MNKTLTISSNARLGRGGQGLNLRHMVEGLGASFDLAVVSQDAGDRQQWREIPSSRLADILAKVPIARRLRDWQTLLSESSFDRRAAQVLTPTDLFQGATGQCLHSFKRARQLGARLVLDVVTTHVDDFAAQQERECALFGIRGTVHPRLRKRMILEYEAADLIRVMSHHAQRTLAERGVDPEKILVVPPPLSLDDFTASSLDHSTFRVCYVGLLEPWKGFHYLIEAFSALNLPDSALDLWGGSGSRPVTRYLEDQMARNPSIHLIPAEVRTIGYARVYGESSVFVSPSLADGFGYVVAEAMASGIPVIVTSSTGAADVVIDGVNGYIIPPRDREALADRLLHLAQNPSLVSTMGTAARKTAMQLTIDAFRACYVPTLQSLKPR